MDDDVVVNLPEGTLIESFNTTAFDASESPLYISAKELNDAVTEPFFDNFGNSELFEQGVEVRLLEPGKKWVTGKLHLRIAFEFIPDEPSGDTRPHSTDAVMGRQ